MCIRDRGRLCSICGSLLHLPDSRYPHQSGMGWQGLFLYGRNRDEILHDGDVYKRQHVRMYLLIVHKKEKYIYSEMDIDKKKRIGLTDEQVKQSREQHGKNVLTRCV